MITPVPTVSETETPCREIGNLPPSGGREVNCGHKRVYEDISACQKSWMERCQRCPNCQYKRDKAYVEKLSAEINSPELLEMWLKETPPTKTSRKGGQSVV